MTEIGVRLDGGQIEVWMHCDRDDALGASSDELRDPVVRALLVGRAYMRAEWLEPHVLNLVTTATQRAS